MKEIETEQEKELPESPYSLHLIYVSCNRVTHAVNVDMQCLLARLTEIVHKGTLRAFDEWH